MLVVDDNEINRLVAVELLSELGYETEIACNGLEAVAKARRTQFGAILMDCQMPEMDGFQATAEIRKFGGELGKVPIIALTAHAMTDDRDKVLRGGMDDYASKPIRARVLERLLRRWINAAGALPLSRKRCARAAGGRRGSSFVARAQWTGSRPRVAPLRAGDRAVSQDSARVDRLIDARGERPGHARREATRAQAEGQLSELGRDEHGRGMQRRRVGCRCMAVTSTRERPSALPAHLAVVAPLLTQLTQRRASNDS